MRDNWTITGGTPGAAGTVDIEVTLDGNFAFAWSSYLAFYVGVDFPGGVPDKVVELACRTDTGCNGASPYFGTGTLQRAFTFGSPLELVFSMIGSTGAQNGGDQSLDAWSSARITGITVRDEVGNVVPGFGLTADSGHDYLADLGGPVPEPATWTMLAAGVALAVAYRRRRAY